MVSCRRLRCKLSEQGVRPGTMAREGSTSTLCVIRSSLHTRYAQQPMMGAQGSVATNREPPPTLLSYAASMPDIISSQSHSW